MQTDYSAPWRSARFTVKDDEAKAVRANYNAIADGPGADIAMRYLRIVQGVNNTGLAKELAGDAGAALIRVYGDTAPQGDSPTKNSVGIGADWVCPQVEIVGNQLLIGPRPKKRRDSDTRTTFALV